MAALTALLVLAATTRLSAARRLKAAAARAEAAASAAGGAAVATGIGHARAVSAARVGAWPFDLGDAESLASDTDLAVPADASVSAEDEALPLPPLTPSEAHQAPHKLPRRAAQLTAINPPAFVTNPDAATGGWWMSGRPRTTGMGIEAPGTLQRTVDEFDLDPEDQTPQGVQHAPPAVRQPRALAAAQSHVSKTRADAVAAVPLDPKARMHRQCLEFAAWVKVQATQTKDVVRLWKGTCTPAIKAGGASAQYISMCENLGGALSKFAEDPNWTPEAACKVVLTTFRESGVGSSPFVG